MTTVKKILILIVPSLWALSGCTIGPGNIDLSGILGEPIDTTHARPPADARGAPYAIAASDPSVAYAVGESLWVTTNGGKSWSGQRSSLGACRSVTSVPGGLAWAGSSEGRILHTADSGRTWREQPCDLARWDGVRDIEFCHPDNGWAVTMYNVLHTTNGGATWDYEQPDSSDWNYQVSVVTPLDAWIMQLRKLRHTTDGGDTWTDVRPSQGYLIAFSFIEGGYGWVAVNDSGYSRILYTTDSGISWNQGTTSPYVYMQPSYAMTRVSQEVGWVGGYNGYAYSTSDGGVSWEEIYMDHGAECTGLAFPEPDVGWAAATSSWIGVGDIGWILHTSDGGRTWQTQ